MCLVSLFFGDLRAEFLISGFFPGGGALGPNMYGCVSLRCCDFYPVWEHTPQFKYPRLGAKLQKNHTLSGSKGSRKYTVVLSGSENLKRVYPFGSIFAENDTRLGSKNGENYTLSSGTYPVPKTSKCPPPRWGGFLMKNTCRTLKSTANYL